MENLRSAPCTGKWIWSWLAFGFGLFWVANAVPSEVTRGWIFWTLVGCAAAALALKATER